MRNSFRATQEIPYIKAVEWVLLCIVLLVKKEQREEKRRSKIRIEDENGRRIKVHPTPNRRSPKRRASIRSPWSQERHCRLAPSRVFPPICNLSKPYLSALQFHLLFFLRFCSLTSFQPLYLISPACYFPFLIRVSSVNKSFNWRSFKLFLFKQIYRVLNSTLYLLFSDEENGRSDEEAMQSQLVWNCFSSEGGTWQTNTV